MNIFYFDISDDYEKYYNYLKYLKHQKYNKVHVVFTNKKKITYIKDFDWYKSKNVTSVIYTVDLSRLTGVVTIGKHFLSGLASLNNIDLSGLINVTTIDDWFLSGCTSLSNIDLSSLTNVKTIG